MLQNLLDVVLLISGLLIVIVLVLVLGLCGSSFGLFRGDLVNHVHVGLVDVGNGGCSHVSIVQCASNARVGNAMQCDSRGIVALARLLTVGAKSPVLGGGFAMPFLRRPLMKIGVSWWG